MSARLTLRRVQRSMCQDPLPGPMDALLFSVDGSLRGLFLGAVTLLDLLRRRYGSSSLVMIDVSKCANFFRFTPSFYQSEGLG